MDLLLQVFSAFPNLKHRISIEGPLNSESISISDIGTNIREVRRLEKRLCFEIRCLESFRRFMVGRSWAGKTDRPKGWETLREIYTGVVAPSLPTPDDRTTTTEFQRFVLSGPVSVFTQQQQGQKGRGGNEACTYHHGRFNPAPSLIYRLASNQNLYISYHDRDLSTLIDRYTLERPVSHFHELRNVDANPVVFRLSRRLA